MIVDRSFLSHTQLASCVRVAQPAMMEEEYQQEAEAEDAGMDEGTTASGTPISMLEVRTACAPPVPPSPTFRAMPPRSDHRSRRRRARTASPRPT
jgi:hypothetical protein